LAKRICYPLTLEAALLWNAMLHLDRGEPELALQRLDGAEAVVAEQRIGFVFEPRFSRGAALCAHGVFGEAAACLREGLATQLGAVTWRSHGFTNLAEALARRGEHREALAAVREGQAHRRRPAVCGGQRSFTASRASRLLGSTDSKKVNTL